MAVPSRAQITAAVAKPLYRVSIFNGSTWVTQTTSHVLNISGNIESGGGDNATTFGDSVTVSATVTLSNLAAANIPVNWKNQLIRIEFAFDTSDYVVCFVGVILKKSYGLYEIIVECGGLDRKIDISKLYTGVFFRRPVATKTSVLTVEDPDNISYVGGLINELLWRTGGRPHEQRASYVNADFYYMCDQSLITIEWAWFSGENLLDELYTLARAGGGQIYQGANDVIRYVQPLNISSLVSNGFTIGDSYYGSAAVSESSEELVGTIRAVYTPRYLQGNQVVYDSKEPRLLQPGEIAIIEGATSLPVYQYTQQNDITALIKATTSAADPVTLANYTIYTYSQKFTITITNDVGLPVAINTIILTGLPVAASEKGYVSVGSTKPERSLEDNPYVQNKYHAEMLARMAYDFSSTTKPVITLSDCPFDPDRYIGEIVDYNSTAYAPLNGLYRITGLSHDLGGISMSIKMVNVVSLPVRGNMFIIGTSYSGSDTRQVSY